MDRRLSSVVLGLTVVALALTGCSGDVARSAQVDVAPLAVEDSLSPSPSPEAPSPSPSVSPSPVTSASPAVSPSPKKPPPKPSPAPSFDVVAVQRQLTDLKYYAGPIDGRLTAAMKSAVMAFQKVQGLPRNGSVGASTLQALAAPAQPVLRDAGPADRVEVDLTKQVLYLVKGGSIERIMPVSSGNGATYGQKNGAKARALTPAGYYTIERRIVGVRKADLGILYDPQYFYKGWAIHGSDSVPAGPASHGCVRVSRADAKFLLQAMPVGMAVHLYGGEHTFPAGSSAPGTDTPSGDGGGAVPVDPPPAPVEPAPSPASPLPDPTPSVEPTPTPSVEPSPTPSPLPPLV